MTKRSKQEVACAVEEIARRRGGCCLLPYTETGQRMLWRCAEGHEWYASPRNVLWRGSWCPHCAHRARLTIDVAQHVAEERGGRCLSTSCLNSHDRLTWQCHQGHVWEALFYAVKNGGDWCPICPVAVLESLALTLVKSRGGSVLSGLPTTSKRTKLLLLCAAQHKFERCIYNLQMGAWCPQCTRGWADREYCERLAESRGGAFLSQFDSPTAKYRWRCGEGHEWLATPRYCALTWCATCTQLQRGSKALKRFIDHIEGFAGRCDANTWLGSGHRYQVTCKYGHSFALTPNELRSSKWCPVCRCLREEICREVLERLTGEEFPRCRPAWLIGQSGRRLELDGYSEKLRLAFEYNGAQHYKRVRFYFPSNSGVKQSMKLTLDGFEQQQKRDAHKRRLCDEQGVDLIVVPYYVKDITTFLKDCLLMLGHALLSASPESAPRTEHSDAFDLVALAEAMS